VLEHVRQHDHVEVPVGQLLEDVARAELQVVTRVVRARESEVTGIVIHTDDVRAGSDDEVVGELPLAGPDVEHTLPRPHPFDEEVVVARQTVLRMHAVLVGD
jgi:hypothetical protein